MSLAAIYPGSFDPLTNGHMDIIRRAANFADRLIVAVLHNTQKQPLFSVNDRLQMIREATADIKNVEADSFEGLLVEYAAKRGADLIVRGIRAVSDYESEMQMAAINRRLRPGTETVFLLAAEEFGFLSSRLIKELIALGGDASGFVPPSVAARLQDQHRPSR